MVESCIVSVGASVLLETEQENCRSPQLSKSWHHSGPLTVHLTVCHVEWGGLCTGGSCLCLISSLMSVRVSAVYYTGSPGLSLTKGHYTVIVVKMSYLALLEQLRV